MEPVTPSLFEVAEGIRYRFSRAETECPKGNILL